MYVTNKDSAINLTDVRNIKKESKLIHLIRTSIPCYNILFQFPEHSETWCFETEKDRDEKFDEIVALIGAVNQPK